jgi:hypothetical protein
MKSVNLLHQYIIDEDISNINKFIRKLPFDEFHSYESFILSKCITYSKAELYRYYKNKGFRYMLLGRWRDKNYKIQQDLYNGIKYNTIRINIFEELKKEMAQYHFKELLFLVLENSLREKHIEFARELYFTYIEIYNSSFVSSIMIMFIEHNVNDVFVEYVKKCNNMKFIRLWADMFENTFVLKWMYDNNQMCNVEKDPYCRITPYYRVNTHYRYLLGAYGLNYDGKKANDEIYVKYMTTMMKMISK